MNDDRDYFAPRPVQPTIFGHDVCRPGWVQPLPELAAPPLYTPNADAPPPTLDEAQLDAAIAEIGRLRLLDPTLA